MADRRGTRSFDNFKYNNRNLKDTEERMEGFSLSLGIKGASLREKPVSGIEVWVSHFKEEEMDSEVIKNKVKVTEI